MLNASMFMDVLTSGGSVGDGDYDCPGDVRQPSYDIRVAEELALCAALREKAIDYLTNGNNLDAKRTHETLQRHLNNLRRITTQNSARRQSDDANH